jgi:hypothetical protein
LVSRSDHLSDESHVTICMASFVYEPFATFVSVCHSIDSQLVSIRVSIYETKIIVTIDVLADLIFIIIIIDAHVDNERKRQ